jgi:hypothetical protein
MVAFIIKLPNGNQAEAHLKNISDIFEKQFAPDAGF